MSSSKQLFEYLLKVAAYNYNPAATRGRNKYPSKLSSKPEVVAENTGVQETKVKANAEHVSDVTPKPGKNKNSFDRQLPFPTHLHPFNTISGTGYGRNYWQTKDNPWKY